jgi:zinc protease
MQSVTRITIAVFAGCLLAPTARAQRETPPPVGTPQDVRLPARRHFTLPNGLQVTMVPFGTVPKVSIAIAVRASGAHEARTEVSLSRVLASLMNEGTRTRTAVQVAEQAASMGGEVSVSSGTETTSIIGEVLAEHGAALVELMADVALHPLLPAAELTRIKANLARQNAIAQTQSQPVAMAAFRKTLYGDHPYGRMFPDSAMLAGYSIAQVKGFYARNFGAARSRVYVAGMFNAAVMEAAIRRAFSGWQRGVAPVTVPVPPRGTTRTVTMIDRPDAVQSTVIIGLRVPPPRDTNATALEVTDALLGGAFGSRITTNIREQKGYTYSPYSTVTSFRGESYWAEQADVTTNVTGASLTEIVREVNRLRSEAPPDAELTGIKNNMAGIFTLRIGSRQGLIGELRTADMQGLGDAYLTGYVQRVLAVTPATVQRIAQRYLTPSQMAIVVVGDKKTVDAQLAAFRGPVP